MSTTLYRGGRVWTGTGPGSGPPPTAVLLDGGTVAWVGGDGGQPAAGTVVELAGALLTPAFVDAHVHTTSTGLALLGLDLSGTASLADALAAVQRAARAGGGRPVLGAGWDETRWPERRPPTRRELDRAGYGGLVYLARVDVHSAAVSSALVAACPGLDGLAGFSPDGPLTRDAHHAVRRVARAALTAGQRTAAQRAALARAAAVGIGCLHELAGPDVSDPDDLAALVALAAAEPGPEVLPYWGAAGPDGRRTAVELGALGAAGDVFADGSFGSHTACLASPYEDDPGTRGVAYLDAEQISEHAAACTREGLQAGFHAIGDAAVETVLRGFAAAARAVGPAALSGARHRVEHAELLPPGGAAELARLGLVASVQPCFDALWGGVAGMYADRLGVQRAMATNPFLDLARAGVPLAFGSDAPVSPLGPWAAVRAAVRHHHPGQRLPVAAALAAHTRGGWYAAGRDGGVLVPGAPATFAVWTVPGPVHPDGLPTLAVDERLPSCRATVVRGTTVFTAREWEG